MVRLYNETHNVLTAICRFYNVYSVINWKREITLLIGIFEKQFRNNDSLTITSDGKQRRFHSC